MKKPWSTKEMRRIRILGRRYILVTLKTMIHISSSVKKSCNKFSENVIFIEKAAKPASTPEWRQTTNGYQSCQNYLLCYIPPVCVVGRTSVKSGSNDSAWLTHIVYISMLTSSGMNPAIHCFRIRGFRRALIQLVNDACGKTPFQDSDQKLRFQHNVPH